MNKKYNFNEESKTNFIKICNESLTMSQACAKLGMHFNTFLRYAKKFKCYKPNQGSKGVCKGHYLTRLKTSDILNGTYPEYPTYKLRNRLLEEKIFKYECFNCHISEWLEKHISLELDHINGNRFDHNLNNLRLLCPNCHSQTHTFRSKNI